MLYIRLIRFNLVNYSSKTTKQFRFEANVNLCFQFSLFMDDNKAYKKGKLLIKLCA